MIDLHCHILPELDDGAKNWDESVKMVEIAKNGGINHIVATPHIYPEFYFPEIEKVKEKFEELKSKVKDINLYLGCDLHLTPETIKYLKNGRALTINGGNYVLIEPPEFFNSQELEEMLFYLRGEGYVPIITHPERYEVFREKKELLLRLVEQGNFLQITSASITGYFGEVVQDFCRQLLKLKIVHLIASDGHSPRKRIPFLKEAYDKIEMWESLDYVDFLKENARCILFNQELKEYKVEKKKRKFFKKILEKIW